MTPDLATLADRLTKELGDAVAREAPLGSLTTWRVGGPAAVLVRVADRDELAVVAGLAGPTVPLLVLGRGSNLLVADGGFPGLVIALGPGFETVDVAEHEVRAGGAVALPVLARRCAAAGAAGLGFYVGIPGSVGGAVRMNAGGHGRETREALLDATVVAVDGGPGTPTVWDQERLALGYRRSALSARDVVIGARWRVHPGDPEELKAELAEIVRWRTEHQPGGANAGSVFRNPPGDAAGRLIDQECGLSGTRRGGAVVSDKHANFIQAEAGATAADVDALIGQVYDAVLERTGVALEVEVHRVGFAP